MITSQSQCQRVCSINLLPFNSFSPRQVQVFCLLQSSSTSRFTLIKSFFFHISDFCLNLHLNSLHFNRNFINSCLFFLSPFSHDDRLLLFAFLVGSQITQSNLLKPSHYSLLQMHKPASDTSLLFPCFPCLK
jgi:hypothetical protein